MTLKNQTLDLRSDVRELDVLATWVDQFSDEISLAPERRGELQVALEEVVINVIKHGYASAADRSLSVTLTADEDFVSAEVVDDAAAYNPLDRPAIDTDLPLECRSIGGLGVHMVKHLMESVKYQRRAAQNVLTLRCHRAPVTAPAEIKSNLAAGA